MGVGELPSGIKSSIRKFNSWLGWRDERSGGRFSRAVRGLVYFGG